MGAMTVSVVPKRYTEAEAGNFQKFATVGTLNHIRRPTRGIQLKEDTFATIRLVAAESGKAKYLIDGGSNRVGPRGKALEINGKRATDVYSNFFIQAVRQERMEKSQVLETFGDAYLFLYGERPRVLTIQGILLNTFDFNWEAEWNANYDQYLRGTACVENDARVFLTFDQTMVGGYILNTSTQKGAQERNFVEFTFTFFVTSEADLSNVGNRWALPGISATTTKKMSEVESKFYNPSPSPSLQYQLQHQSGNEETSLFDAVGSAISAVAEGVNYLKGLTNFSLKLTADVLNGTVVRIPVGFAGTLEYDKSDLDPDKYYVTKDGEVTYSAFSANLDEYVGSADHYSSALHEDGSVRMVDVGGQDLSALKQQGNAWVEEAKKVWSDAGYWDITGSLGPVESGLISAALGLVLTKFSFADKTTRESSRQPVKVEEEVGSTYQVVERGGKLDYDIDELGATWATLHPTTAKINGAFMVARAL